ncbi:alpha-L-rhamnosidase [Cohnella nanjingensis]|uniref:alpha-L-rhamnosidase n=1 Tax=Cohnella nanjingensis TaxID=1387779 RepID=A0A7X0VI84_9BACL|nr:alpha-L-rhamnosidase [Cohnella nanjingensis]MBB6674935.1 family 78 glycoside hydrolase catalytic domain [Cohnella nanjingensis]
MSRLMVIALTNDYRTNPLGTDVRKPRLSWKLASDRRGTLQAAYRIQVAGPDGGFDAPLWDTERTPSDQSVHVVYEGPALGSRTRYSWRVKVWDNHGAESDWSETAWWETALLNAAEWQAEWLTPDPRALDPLAEPAFLLRKPFELRAGIRSARVYATAAGVYDLYVNGNRVGEDLLAPGWTSYNKRHAYQTYDVTDRLRAGPNAVGVIVADGWFKGNLAWENQRHIYGDRRGALLQLHVVYEDGTEQIVASDESWKASTGPLLYAEIYHGERYDARLEQGGWSEAGFPDAAWHATVPLDRPRSMLGAQENWPTRVTETLKPVALIRTPAGETVLDMGQNMVGRIRFSVEAPAGTEIRLQHAEVLDQEGNFYTKNLRKAKQLVSYTAKGEGVETYAPQFTFQGFRYVKIEGYPGQERDLPLDRFVGEVVHSDMAPTGTFDSSSPLVNQLQRNIAWGQRGNFLDLPTDCPQRDERLGWTGDAQVFARTAAFNFQVGPFFTKWLRDLKADQKADGGVPFVVPNVLGDDGYSSAAWGDAAVIVPWTAYLVYDDKRLLAEQYGSMKAWVGYIRAQGDQPYLWNTGFHFGDWLGLDAKENSYIGATPRDLIATAFYAYSTRLVRDAAVVLGLADDARLYTALHARIVAAFREEFVTPSGRLAAPTQTAHVLALTFGLVEGAERERVAKDLNQLVVDQEYHLTTGFVGTPYLCFALSDNGYHDTAVKLLMQESYPSWLYSVTKGATTIWEHWDGIKPDGSFWSEDMNSYNHYAYGAIGDWLYRVVAGLDMDEGEAGYRRLRVHPRFAGESLGHARASFESVYGRAEAGWSVRDGQRTVEVTVPANATAEITLPGAKLETLTESGRAADGAEGVALTEQTAEGVRLAVGSGTYSFVYSG